MKYYRITKYNPAFRNEQGFYTKNEWTSISDIGKTFDEEILTIEGYKQIEDAYVNAVNIILNEKDISQMNICELEKSDCVEEHLLSQKDKEFYEKISDFLQVGLNDMSVAVRLVLRELIWCNFSCPAKNVKIEFGYDYYMYVKCDELHISIQEKILECGLFVELLSEDR